MVLTLTLLLLSTLWKTNILNTQTKTSLSSINVFGCLDVNATNYDAAAKIQAKDEYGNLLCIYASCKDVPSTGCMYERSFAPYHQNFSAADCVNYGGTPCTITGAILGCMDENASNYDAAATVQAVDQWDNLICTYSSCTDIPDAEGCIYADAYAALRDDFTAADCAGYGGTACVDASEGCMDANATNYNSDATEPGLDQYGNSVCIYTSCDDIPDAEGCIYADAYAALREDFTAGECSSYGGTPCTITGAILGCMDENASNYDAAATVQAVDQWDKVWINTETLYASTLRVTIFRMQKGVFMQMHTQH